MTNKEAAAKLGVSVSTARRWMCGWCDQDYLSIAHGVCGGIYDRCNTEDRVRQFREGRNRSGKPTNPRRRTMGDVLEFLTKDEWKLRKAYLNMQRLVTAGRLTIPSAKELKDDMPSYQLQEKPNG